MVRNTESSEVLDHDHLKEEPGTQAPSENRRVACGVSKHAAGRGRIQTNTQPGWAERAPRCDRHLRTSSHGGEDRLA